MQENWRLVAALAAALSVIALFLLVPLPESPSWLLTKGREKRAEKSLKVFRGVRGGTQRSDILNELQEMTIQVSTDRNKRGKNEGPCTHLRQADVYKPLLMMIAFFGFQQFSGIFVVIVYATKFSTEANVQIDAFLCTVLIGITRVVGTCVSAYVMDKFGRKPPTIFSGTGMTICMFSLSIYKVFDIDSFRMLPGILLLVYIFMATIGFQSIPFAMCAEVFPRKARGLACGLTISCGYVMSFIAIKLYPTMVYYLKSDMVFLIYGTVSLIGTLFGKFVLLETKGKTLQQIEEHFQGKNIRPDLESARLNKTSAT